MRKRKKSALIVLIACIVVAVAAIGTGIGYAVWKNTLSAQDVTDVPSSDWNESLKYQVFALLDSDGNVLKSEPQTAEDVGSVAFVGYTGLETDLVIPEAVFVPIGDARTTKRVTKILTLPSDGGGAKLVRNEKRYAYPNQDIGLKNNDFIVSVSVPASVVKIASGAFHSMRELEKLTISGSEPIDIGDAAFSNASKLSVLVMTRNLTGNCDFNSIFAGTKLV